MDIEDIERKRLPRDVKKLQDIILSMLDGGGCDICHGTGQVVTGFVDGPKGGYPIVHRCECMDKKPSITWSDERTAVVRFLRGFADSRDISAPGIDETLQEIADAIDDGEHTKPRAK